MQRINLYQEDLKSPKILLPTRQMLQIAGLLAVGVTALCYWAQTLPEQPRSEANAVQAQADQLDKRVKMLQEQVNKMAPNEALARQVDALQNRLNNTRRLRHAVIPPSSVIPFSQYLEGLARQSREGIWLTEIRVGDKGHAFLLRGGALDPAMLPEYIQALESEPAYAGLSFDNLSMTMVEDDLPHLQFSIATRCLPNEDCK